MPSLGGFLKKKRTREGNTDQPSPSASKPPQLWSSPIAPSAGSQPGANQHQAPGVGGAGAGAVGGGGGVGGQNQNQNQNHHPHVQPAGAAPSSSSTTAATTTSATNPTVTATSTSNNTAAPHDPQNQNASSGINHLIHPPQHDGAVQSTHSLNSPSPLSNAVTSASVGPPPVTPILSVSASASPGTDPNALYQQQQAARPPPPQPATAIPNSPDKMQTDHQPQQQQQQQQQQLQPQHQQHAVAQQQQQPQQQGHQARATKGKYSLTDFDILRTLGTGSFGRVHLVQSKHNQRFYAIKVLKKAQVVKMKQVEHTNDERRMLSDVKHPFLITLWGTFQDWKSLYMVMDFVEGGELFSLLRKSGRFPNPVAKFYAAEVTLALEYLHSKNIIYRDLKPENLLLDRHGHLKITDFGFAKHVPDKTWTLCGTPDYLAPEVVSNKGYNKSVDWWSLGILIYEMLCGYTPFWDSGSPMRIYENISKGKVKYPAYIVPEAQNLLERLITADLTKRLGNLFGGPSDVKNHPWFAEVTWDRLARKDIDAPYTPPVKAGTGDASQFDKYPEEMEKYGVPGGNDDYGHLFVDF